MGAHRKVFVWLGFYLLVSTIPVLAQRRSGDSGDLSRPDGGSQSGAREINIATFFNCTTGQESLNVLQESCDVFAYAAAELAREVINDEVNNNNNTRPEVNFYPVQLKSSVHSSQIYLEAFHQLSGIIKRKRSQNSRIHKFVGPPHLDQLDSLQPFFGRRANRIDVLSYAVTSASIEQYSRVSSTLPDHLLVNSGRLALLAHFGWIRSAILYSSDSEQVEAALNFGNQLAEGFSNTVDKDIRHRIFMSVRIEHGDIDLDDQLLYLSTIEMKVINGFFGPKVARRVLCQARHNNLTTSTHIWILPSYSDPQWWKRSSNQRRCETTGETSTCGCSDEEMLEILQSTIFVGAVKLPPFDSSLAEFTPRLFDKVSQLFPHLNYSELLPYLLHSHAVNAYDAVMLASYLSLESCWKECEKCRIYRPTFSDDLVSAYCSENCPKGQEIFTVCAGRDRMAAPPPEVADNLFYGQVMITQFVDGHHCPMVLWWGTSNITRVMSGNFLRVSELPGYQCGENRAVVRDIGMYLSNFSRSFGCPSDFIWKDSDNPPVAFIITPSYVTAGPLTVMCLLTTFGALLIISLCVLNIRLRNNPTMKASSPHLNIVMLTGYFLLLPPVLLFNGLIQSSNRIDNISEAALSVLCKIIPWFTHIGFSLIFTTVLVKTWRLYYIFSRKPKTVNTSKFLSDGYLFAGIVLFTSVSVILMTVWTSIDELTSHFRSIILPLSKFESSENLVSFRSLNLTTCAVDSELTNVIPILIIAYYVLQIVAAFFFILANKRIYSNFKDDTLHSFRALIFGCLMVSIREIAFLLVQSDYRAYLAVWWLFLISLVVLNIFAVLATFLPAVCKTYSHSRKRRKLDALEQQKEASMCLYSAATTEEKQLRKQLAEKNRAIEELKRNKIMKCSVSASVICTEELSSQS